MTVLEDCRVLWLGTHAAVAGISGWSRDEDCDDRFLQGMGFTYTGPVEGGGPHGHTDIIHNHVANVHPHDFGAVESTGTVLVVDPPSPSAVSVSAQVHSHGSVASRSDRGAYIGTIGNIDNATANPPYVEVIVLKPDDGNQDIPDDCVCWTDEVSLPTGFAKTNGSGGTPDLDGRFVRGAAFEDDGGATGGSATHTHTDETGHLHGQTTHTHGAKAATAATAATIGTPPPIGAPITACRDKVHHIVSLLSAGGSNTSSTEVPALASSSEPSHIELLGIQNTSGLAATSDGVILPYVGPVSGISNSDGWYLCDGSGNTPDLRNRQIKITTDDMDIGVTGGSDAHTHTTAAHGHTHAAPHTHTASVAFTGRGVNHDDSSPSVNTLNQDTDAHTHSWVVAPVTSTLQDATLTMSSDDGRAPYLTVVFVKKISTTVRIEGGRILGAILAA